MRGGLISRSSAVATLLFRKSAAPTRLNTRVLDVQVRLRGVDLAVEQDRVSMGGAEVRPKALPGECH